MAGFESKSPEELVVISALVTFLVSEDAEAGDLNVVGNMIVAIGSLILTWAAQKELLDTARETASQNTALDDMRQQIKDLQEKCKKLEQPSKKDTHT